MLSGKVDKAQSTFLNDLIADYMGKFQTDDKGNLLASTSNMRMAIKLDQFFDALDENTLRSINTQFGKDMLKLTPLSGRYYSAMGTPKDLVESISEKVGFIEQGIGIKDGEIIKGGYLDTLAKMPEVRQQLKDYVITSVANKKGYSDYLRGMKEMVVGAGQKEGILKRYYRQYAFDTFNQTDAAINKHYADSLDLKWFVYTGSVIDTTRPFCRKRAGKTYNTEETEKWKCDPDLIAKPKGKKCDDSYNPLIERGRYNCRHTIRYITEELACQNGRQDACEGKIEQGELITKERQEFNAQKTEPTPKINPNRELQKDAKLKDISKTTDVEFRQLSDPRNEYYKKPLDLRDRGAIHDYTQDLYGPINTGTRKGWRFVDEFERAEAKETVLALKNAMNKIPNYTGESLRVTSIPDMGTKGLFDNLKVGEMFSEKGFMSTTIDPSIARKFAPKNIENTLLIRVRGKSGKFIAPLSDMKNEMEVLFKPNSKFVVTYKSNGLTDKVNVGNFWGREKPKKLFYIEIQEI